MILAKNAYAKFGLTLPPQSVNGTSTNGTAIDTAGASAYTALDGVKLQESDDNSTWVDITGAAFTAPTDTDDNKMWACFVEKSGARQRYVRVVSDPGAAATLFAAVIILECLEQSPNTATEAGLAERKFIPAN